MRSTYGVLALGIGAACAVALSACSGDDSNAAASGTDGGSPGDGSATHDASPGVDGGGDSGAKVDGAVDSGSGDDASGDSGGQGDGEAGPPPPASALYTMTNAAAGNAVLGFARAADGSLTPMTAPFPSGGAGSGAGLGEQGAVTLDPSANRLYAVNAGDGTFSVLPVAHDGSLGTAQRSTPVAGLVGPKSVTFRGDVVYVLFEGDTTHASAIAGFTIGASGPTPIAGSTLNLSSDTKGVDPAQIQFTPDGKYLVVTEKATNQIDTFAIDTSGVATKVGFYPTASAGDDAGVQMVPYGFAFVGATLVVSEAGSTGVGTYTFSGGAIAPVTFGSQFLPTDPAPCWVAVSADWAYVANAKGPDISGYAVAAGGGLTPIGSATNAIVATTGTSTMTDAGTVFAGPTDEAVSTDGKFLYALDPGVPAIGVFAVGASGELTRVGSTDYAPGGAALPAGVVGLAAR